MKRIDEKVKEIEKKDKKNRLLFIAFVSVLAVGMAYVYLSEKKIEKKDSTILVQETTITEQEIKLTDTYKKLEALYDTLKMSLSPAAYWKAVKKDNTVEGYIAYLTNDWGVDKDAYLDKALTELKSNRVGSIDFQGWLWVGYNYNAGYQSNNIVEIVYRKGAEDQNLTSSKIQIGDIVRLTTESNRTTYKKEKLRRKNTLGWRNRTKAVVIDTFNMQNNAEFNIKVKYY